MCEKLNNLRSTCNIAVIVTPLIYIILWFWGNNSGFHVIRITIAAIDLIGCSIKCGVEAICEEKLVGTIIQMAIYLLLIIIETIMLI